MTATVGRWSWFLFAAAICAGAATARATLYSAAGDFSLASNPNGVWTYGTVPYSGGIPNSALFDDYEQGMTTNDFGLTGDLEVWIHPASGIDPNVSHNANAGAISCCGIIWDPGEISMGPGIEFVTLTGVRFTAPFAGLGSVSATFNDNQTGGDSQDVWIFYNNSLIFSNLTGTTVGSGVSTNFALSLAAGDTLDFLVGAGFAGGSGQGGNNTQLIALINLQQVPEPGTLWLLAVGALVCGLLTRRR